MFFSRSPSPNVTPSHAGVSVRRMVFDLDGTLITGDLWSLVTKVLAQDPAAFDTAKTAWKKRMGDNPLLDKAQASKEMMQLGLTLLKEDARNGKSIQQAVLDMPNETMGIVKDAIDYLRACLERGDLCVISTADYEEAAKGFIERIVREGLLTSELAEKIHLSSSRIDWDALQVAHINVGPGKLQGLAGIFGVPQAELPGQIHMAFGDDPEGNDESILECSQYGFVIHTPRNGSMAHPPQCIRTDWASILSNKDLLEDFHGQMLSAQLAAFSSLLPA